MKEFTMRKITRGVNPMVVISANNQTDLLDDLTVGLTTLLGPDVSLTVSQGNIVCKMNDVVLNYCPYVDPEHNVYFATVIALDEGKTVQISSCPKYIMREVLGMPVSYNSLRQMFNAAREFVGLGTEEFTEGLKLDDKLEVDDDEEYTFFATDNIQFTSLNEEQ